MGTDALGGLLLTGGDSQRMGIDKATIEIDGTTQAQRSAELLRAVVDLVLEVGPGFTDLEVTREDPPGQGPLAAIVAGRNALVRNGLPRSAACIVLACDLPLINATVLEVLSAPPRNEAVLPIIDEMPQPLCARWSAADLDEAERRLSVGERSLRRLPNTTTAELLDEASFGDDAFRLSDADTPQELTDLLQRGRPRT
jgi:molybdopterin-guanine dinucleotide biosynthesis protein A